jgi:O-antigen ligase
VNPLAPLFAPLLRAPPALRVGAGFALVATLAAGLPHAFVSNAIVVALGGILFATLSAPGRGALGQSAREAKENGLWLFVAAWIVWVLLRFGLSWLWREPISWSGLGHSVALGLPFVLALCLRGPLQRVGDSAIMVGLCGVALLAVINALLPGNRLRLFEGYRVYLGNDSIAIDMMLTLLASGVTLKYLSMWLRGGREPTLKQCGLIMMGLLPLFAFAQSRSALIVFVIALGLGALIVARTWLQRLFVPALVLGVVAAAYVVSPLARSRMEKAVAEVSAAVSDHYVATSQGQRLALASVSWRVVKDRPIVGHGLGTWRKEFAARVPPQWQFAIGRHTSPHNEYMHIAAQLGVVAVLIYVGIWLAVFRMGVRQLRAQASPWLLLISIAFVVGSVTNVMLWDFRFWAPFTALLASALASAKAEST